jgi:outer membrane protein W
MRRVFFSLSIVLFAATAFAQSADTLRFSSFFVNPGDTHAAFPVPYSDTAYGGGVEYFATKSLAAQVVVSSELTIVTRFVSTIGSGGTVLTLPATSFVRVHPLDGLIRYHFDTGSRWKPHVGVGARYLDIEGWHNWRTELNAGVTFALTRHLGIDADVRQFYNGAASQKVAAIPGLTPVLAGADEGKNHRYSLGCSWTF